MKTPARTHDAGRRAAGAARFRIAFGVCTVVVLAFSAAGLLAQSTEVQQGPWKIEVSSGSCESLPLFAVKGPGTLFDSANSAALTALTEALGGALQKVCPETKEVILMNGRTRRLMRLQMGPQAQAAPAPAQTGPSTAAPPAAQPPGPPPALQTRQNVDSPPPSGSEIGRASCRERVSSPV